MPNEVKRGAPSWRTLQSTATAGRPAGVPLGAARVSGPETAATQAHVQKYTVVFLRYNGEIIRLNPDSAWLWDKLRTVVEARETANGLTSRLRAVRSCLC